MSRGGVSSAKKSWGNSASNNNSKPPYSNFSGQGRKPGSSFDEDGEELILQERNGPGKIAPKRSWTKLDNKGGSLHTEITGGRHEGMPDGRERDLECGIRTDARQSKPLGVMVTKGMKIEEFRANIDK